MWFNFALAAAFFNALMDLFVKLSSGKINDAFGGVILTSTAALTMLGVTVYTKNRGESSVQTSWQGVLFSLLAGLVVGIATFFMYKMFGTNARLSVAIPFMRVAIILFSILFGVLLLKENLTWKLFLGVTLSILGLYLILNPS